jgi:uncharacterized protein YaaW (UPF0174 family)
MGTQISRRNALEALVAGASLTACPSLLLAVGEKKPQGLAAVNACVEPKLSWTYTELNEFLSVLPDECLVSIQKSLELVAHDAKDVQITDREKAQREVQTGLLWVSSHLVSYPFRNEAKIQYHELVKWVGSDLGVDQWILDTQPTLVVERAIQEKLFVDIWDKMSKDQRRELLEKIDTNGYLKDHAAIASLSGAGALAALSLTVHLAGFAFYTTMSTVICAAAGFFGVTLPFAAYTGASTLVAFLTGPVGWLLLAVAGAAGVALAGRANPRKTAAAICQIHAIKVAALESSEKKDDRIFQALGDPLKRQLVGKWLVQGDDGTIDLSLQSDGTFTAKCYKPAAKEGSSRELLWDGKGTWSVRDKKLSVKRSHVWWKAYYSADPREIVESRLVTNVEPSEIKLEGGPHFKRL